MNASNYLESLIRYESFERDYKIRYDTEILDVIIDILNNETVYDELM